LTGMPVFGRLPLVADQQSGFLINLEAKFTPFTDMDEMMYQPYNSVNGDKDQEAFTPGVLGEVRGSV